MADQIRAPDHAQAGKRDSISGSEEAYRRAIRAFINENIDTHMLREAYESTESDAEGYARCSTEISVRS